MYEVLSKEREIDGICIPTWQRSVLSCNHLEVEVGTNGVQGGDSGHGGRVYFRIEDAGGSCIDVNVIRDHRGTPEGVEILLGGDSELDTFIEALEFAVKVLKEEQDPMARYRAGGGSV